MIESILGKLTTDEIAQLTVYFNAAKLTQHEINAQKITLQIEYAAKLLKTNPREITAKRLMFVWDTSRSTAYRRISAALSQNNVRYEIEPCNNQLSNKINWGI